MRKTIATLAAIGSLAAVGTAPAVAAPKAVATPNTLTQPKPYRRTHDGLAPAKVDKVDKSSWS